MIRVSKSPLKFFQATSRGREGHVMFRRGQVSLTPEMPRYGQLSTLTHRRIDHIDRLRKFY